jgi:signal transduction histidine kinase
MKEAGFEIYSRPVILVLCGLYFFLIPACFSQIQQIDSIPPKGVVLSDGWKFKAGDQKDRANIETDDSYWQPIDPTLDVNDIPQIRQQPIGWLRVRFRVDSNLLHRPLAYHVFQSIASEIYLNGKLIQTYGIVSADKRKIREWRPSNDPEGIIFTQPEQTLAVRFSMQQRLTDPDFITHYNAFIFRISPVSQAAKNVELNHQFPFQFAIFIGFFLVIGLLHLILYVNQPAKKANLYFSIATFCLSVGSLLSLLIYFAGVSMFYLKLAQILCYVIYISGYNLFLYFAVRQLVATHINWVHWVIVAVALIGPIFVFVFKLDSMTYLLAMLLISLSESTRIIFWAYRRGNNKAKILLVTYGTYWVFLAVVIYFPRNENGFFDLKDLMWTLSTISIPLGLAIYLSLDFALTSKELDQRLVQVGLLSDEVARRTRELNSIRQTLAADFHDETGNMLSAITRQAALLKYRPEINADSLKIIENIIANSNQLYASSRHFIWNLNNDSDKARVLFDYLTSFGQVFYNQFDISFSAENRTVMADSLRLEPFAAINLIFIFKEAMNNVVKHADAKVVTLSMTYSDGLLHFLLTDDGKWKEPDHQTTHHGLGNIEKRCLSNQFLLAISHEEGGGTLIKVSAPVIVGRSI